jgi:hypothetical protein
LCSEGAFFFQRLQEDHNKDFFKYDYSETMNTCLVFVNTYFADFICQWICLLTSGLIQLAKYICTFQRYFCKVGLKVFLFPACSFQIRNVSHIETLWATTWQSFVATFIINVVATSTRPWGNWNPNQTNARNRGTSYARLVSEFVVNFAWVFAYGFLQLNSQSKAHIIDIKREIQFVIKKKLNVKLITHWKGTLSWVTTTYSRVTNFVMQLIFLYRIQFLAMSVTFAVINKE